MIENLPGMPQDSCSILMTVFVSGVLLDDGANDILLIRHFTNFAWTPPNMCEVNACLDLEGV